VFIPFKCETTGSITSYTFIYFGEFIMSFTKATVTKAINQAIHAVAIETAYQASRESVASWYLKQAKERDYPEYCDLISALLNASATACQKAYKVENPDVSDEAIQKALSGQTGLINKVRNKVRAQAITAINSATEKQWSINATAIDGVYNVTFTEKATNHYKEQKKAIDALTKSFFESLDSDKPQTIGEYLKQLESNLASYVSAKAKQAEQLNQLLEQKKALEAAIGALK
jgi:hypothetical protein